MCGVVGVVTKLIEHFPTEGMPLDHLSDEDVLQALEQLKCLPIGGAYLCDGTGLGKTIEICAVL